VADPPLTRILFDSTQRDFFWPEKKKIEIFYILRGNFPNPKHRWLTQLDPSHKKLTRPLFEPNLTHILFDIIIRLLRLIYSANPFHNKLHIVKESFNMDKTYFYVLALIIYPIQLLFLFQSTKRWTNFNVLSSVDCFWSVQQQKDSM